MSARPDPPRVGRVYTGPVVHVDRGQLNVPSAPQPTDGFIIDWFRGKKSSAFEAAVSVRRKSQQALVRLTTVTAVLAARTMIAGIGHPAVYAIFRSVVIEVRNRITVSLGADTLTQHKSIVYIWQAIMTTVVKSVGTDRIKLLQLFLSKQDAAKVNGSAAITSLFDALENSFTSPCVYIATNRTHALVMTKEMCEAIILLLDECERVNSEWAQEARRASYPMLARVLVSLGVSDKISRPSILAFETAVRASPVYKMTMMLDSNTGIDAFVQAIGATSREDILVRMIATLSLIVEVLRDSDAPGQERTALFRAPGEDDLQRAESFVLQDSSAREEELRESSSQIDDDDEYWDAEDFILPVIEDTD